MMPFVMIYLFIVVVVIVVAVFLPWSFKGRNPLNASVALI